MGRFLFYSTFSCNRSLVNNIIKKKEKEIMGLIYFLGAVTFLICGACLTLVYIIHKQEKTEAGA